MRTHSAMFFRNEDIFSDVLLESGHIQRCSSGMRTHSAMFFRNEDIIQRCSSGMRTHSAIFFKNEDTFSDVLQE
jgi:hypothetical protein